MRTHKIVIKIPTIAQILLYVLVFSLLLSSGTVYQYLNNQRAIARLIDYLPIFILFLLIILQRPALINEGKGKIELIILGSIAYFSVLALANGSNPLSVTATLMYLSLMLYYFYYYDRYELNILRIYRNYIVILAFVSLILWILGCILHKIPGQYVDQTWGGYKDVTSYFMIQFEREKTLLGGVVITSNRSIFVERAFAAYNFLIGLLYELIIEKKKSLARILVMTVAILSTVSITGLILIIILYFLYFIANGNNKKVVFALKVLFVPVVIFTVVVTIKFLLVDKLSYGYSAISRSNDFSNGIRAWKESPIWGYGYGNSKEIAERFNAGTSNSVSSILTQGGVLLLVPYILIFLKAYINCIQYKKINMAVFTSVFAIYLIFTVVAFRNITIYILLVIGFSNIAYYSRD